MGRNLSELREHRNPGGAGHHYHTTVLGTAKQNIF
jgi:hypothetical protein